MSLEVPILRNVTRIRPLAALSRLGRRVLVEERGVSLLMAVLSLVVLSIVGGSVAVYSTNNLGQSRNDASRTSAYHLAEAGLSDALARLQGAEDPTDTTILPSTTVHYPQLGGSVTYHGTAVTSTDRVTWTITSTGTVAGTPPRSDTLTQTALVRGLVPGADLGSWSRFYQDDAAHCLTIDTVNMPAPVATKSDLCLTNGGSITGASTAIDVGGGIYVTGPTVTAGPRSPSAASGTSWTNPGNVYTSNNGYATYSVPGNGTSNALTISGFGFTLPAGAGILGIRVDIERSASASSRLRDQTVQLVKAGAPTGSNRAVTTTYGTSDSTRTYGSTSDLWGTTWTAAELNASNFGVSLAVQNTNSTATTANVDHVTVTVTYMDETTGGVGTSSQNIREATVGTQCRYNGNAAHNPCVAADHVWADSIVMSSENADLVMPQLDLDYWFNNARPGPKHPCTNAGNNLAPLAFDNDNSATSNNSLQFDNSGTYDMTPKARSYDCQVIENGVMLGRLKWDYTTKTLTIGGTIFFDGDVRFDDDGQLIHYVGRGLIYAAGDVEFDEMVCAGGTGNNSCASSMASWDPSKNYLTIMSNGNAEYDQGGNSCSGLPSNGVTCAGSHPASGLQGVVSAQGNCTIHERFKLSGPVVCGRIILPYEPDGWPTYYPFPSLSELVDGQKYGDIAGASAFEISPGALTG